MAFKQITDGLTLTIPESGTTNWGRTVEILAWTRISAHDHTGSGNGLQIGSTAIADDSITSAKLAPNIGFTQQTTVTPTGTTATIDWDNGNFAALDLSSATGTVTLTLSNPETSGFYRIKILQGATVRTVTFPGTVLFAGGINPTLHQNINTTNVVYLDYDGTNYLATLWDNELS